VQYLGAHDAAPVTWRWTTTSARVGECELATQDARLRHTDWRAEYDLGGVVEAYDVLPEGVEQTFVLRARPAGSGELVIRGAVTTALQNGGVDAGGGIPFFDASGKACVHYGAAVAIDATGRRTPMQTLVVDGGIELRLASEALASATFPLVVDPLLAPVAVANGAQIVDTAIAFDPVGTKNLWLAEVRQTGTDTDLRLYRADADGQNAVLVFSDLSVLWATREPSLGVSRSAGRTLLAMTRHFNSNDEARVRMHVRARADLGFATNVFNAPEINDRNQSRPTVGSDLAIASVASLPVAFQLEGPGAFTNALFSQIHGLEAALGGTGSVLQTFPIADTAYVDHERPTFAKVAVGAARVWSLAYQRFQGVVGGDWDIGIRRIAPGNVVGPEAIPVASVAGSHDMAPRLAGVDDRVMLFATASQVTESAAKPAGSNGHRILGARLDWNGAWATVGVSWLQYDVDARLELGGADFDVGTQSHWALAFRSTVTQNLYLRTYGYRGAEVSRFTVDSPTTGLGTAVGGGVVFNATDEEFVVGYGIDDPGVGSQLRTSRLTRAFLLPWYISASSCSSVQLAWDGPQWIGSQFTGVSFQNAPANSFTVAFVATDFATLQLFGIGGVHDGCWLLVPINGPEFLGTLPVQFAASGTWSLPLLEYLPAMTLRFQAVTFDPAFGEFFSSMRLTVPLER
jgi:hypothetical protein